MAQTEPQQQQEPDPTDNRVKQERRDELDNLVVEGDTEAEEGQRGADTAQESLQQRRRLDDNGPPSNEEIDRGAAGIPSPQQLPATRKTRITREERIASRQNLESELRKHNWTFGHSSNKGFGFHLIAEGVKKPFTTAGNKFRIIGDYSTSFSPCKIKELVQNVSFLHI